MAEQPSAKNTLERIQTALEKGEVSAVPQVVHLVQKLTSKAFSITVTELAELIEKDSVITQKILTLSNTMGYNPIGIAIKTIPQAIQIIGFDRVRNLVVSLLLAESERKAQTPTEQKEASSFCLTSGLLAKQFSANNPNLDAETAFLCASLRNYGQLLFTIFMIEEYREAQELMERVKEPDEAYRKVFGITPLELGHKLLEQDKLPKEIMKCLESVPAHLLELKNPSELDQLLILSDFSSKICEIVTDESLNQEEFTHNIRRLRKNFSKVINLSDEDFDQSLLEVSKEIQQFHNTVGISNEKNHISKSLNARINKDKLTREALPQKSLIKEGKKNSTKETVKITPLEVLEKGLLALKAYKAGNVGDKRILPNMMNDILSRGLELTDVIVLNKTEEENTYRINEGKGPIFRSLLGTRINFLKRKSIFTLCLSRKEDINITNALDEKVIDFIPDWMRMSPPIRSFLLLPVTVEESVEVIFCCASTHEAPIDLTKQKLNLIKQIKLKYTEIKRAEPIIW